MKKTKNIIVLIILLFFQGIFTNIAHPITPSYVRELNLPNYMFGFFFSFMNVGMLVGAPFWGNLADQGKKKNSVLIGFSVYGFAQLLFGLGNIFGPWGLSLFRFLSGFGIAAAFTILYSEIIVLSETNKKAKNIALGTAAVAIGGAIGQYLGGFLYTNSFFIKHLNTDQVINVLIIQCLFSLLIALLSLLIYKPTEVVNGSNKRVGFFEGFKQVKKISPQLLMFLFALVFMTIAATNVDKYLDIYFINDLGYKEDALGTFKMIVGFVSVFTSILIVPLFIKIKKKLLIISLFQVLSAILIVIVFNGTSFEFLTYLYSFYMAYIVIKSTNEPLEREYVAGFGNESNMGLITGVRQSFFSLGTIIGPLIGAFLYEYSPKYVFNSSVIFFLIAIIFIILSGILKKKEILAEKAYDIIPLEV